MYVIINKYLHLIILIEVINFGKVSIKEDAATANSSSLTFRAPLERSRPANLLPRRLSLVPSVYH